MPLPPIQPDINKIKQAIEFTETVLANLEQRAHSNPDQNKNAGYDLALQRGRVALDALKLVLSCLVFEKG